MKYVGIAAACLSSFVSISSAYSGNSWEFRVVNKARLVSDGFRTMENGQWSDNWLHTQIAPGSDWVMDFGHSDGSCNVRTQVSFTDDTYFDYDVDYCKVKTIYVYERSLRAD